MKLNSSKISIIKRLLIGQHTQLLKTSLMKIGVADLASLFSQFNVREMEFFLEVLASIDKVQDVFLELPSSQLLFLFSRLKRQQLESLFKDFNAENTAYFFSVLEEEGAEKEKELKKNLFSKLDKQKKKQVTQFLSYSKNSAGRLMQTDFFSLSVDLNTREALKSLRAKAQKESIYYIYCVDQSFKLVGTLSLRELMVSSPLTPLKDLIQTEVISVKPETSSKEVADLVSHYNFIAIPVVDADHQLLGVITIDDVMDVVQEEATAKIYAQAGLQEGDRVFSSPLKSIKHRAPWMFLNLLLAGLTSFVVSRFEETMNQLIVLASLKNIVASTGGNTAIQSLTVVTRGLATGDFSFSLPFKVILKEIISGLVMGLLTGLGAAFLVYVWKRNIFVSGVIFMSMLLTSLIASCFGAMVPIFLKKMNLDPAMGSGVIVTIIVDIFSFFSFLGIASLGLNALSPIQ